MDPEQLWNTLEKRAKKRGAALHKRHSLGTLKRHIRSAETDLALARSLLGKQFNTGTRLSPKSVVEGLIAIITAQKRWFEQQLSYRAKPNLLRSILLAGLGVFLIVSGMLGFFYRQEPSTLLVCLIGAVVVIGALRAQGIW
jgi:hypothetical protein